MMLMYSESESDAPVIVASDMSESDNFMFCVYWEVVSWPFSLLSFLAEAKTLSVRAWPMLALLKEAQSKPSFPTLTSYTIYETGIE